MTTSSRKKRAKNYRERITDWFSRIPIISKARKTVTVKNTINSRKNSKLKKPPGQVATKRQKKKIRTKSKNQAIDSKKRYFANVPSFLKITQTKNILPIKLKSVLLGKKTPKIIVILSLLITPLVWLFWGIPMPTKLGTSDFPISTKLLDRNGKLLFEIYTERRSSPLKLDEIPDDVINATIAIEDKDFYKHHGISITGIARATYNTIFKNKLQGGSTLTQQLVKNSLLTPERTIKRKLREFALTIAVETIYSKDEILEIYLNQIPYGSTAYGIETASNLYFGKSAKDLELHEAALLAGLPAAPTKFSPFGANPDLAKGRQEAVLRRMVEDEYITKEQMADALEKKLHYAETEIPKAPHFSLWIKDQLAEKYGDALVEQGGLRVTTTLDLDLQEFAQKQVFEEVEKLKKYNVGNGGVLVTRPKSGEILAMVGSKNYFAEDEDGKVNIIFSERQPGSSIKPLNYALGFENGTITPATPLADVPTCFLVEGQKPYCPGNYDNSFHGAVQARFALGNSYNIPAVRVLALNNLENFVDFATSMGITTFTDPSNYGLSLTLGGGEVKPYDMATAFGVFANGGIKRPLISILKVEDWKGRVLEEINPIELEGMRVLSPETSFIISHILHDNNARSSAFGTGSLLNVRGHPEVSVKTGTTNDLRDNWTIGYTSQVLTVVWVGNNDNSKMSGAVSGVSGASPIWNKIMNETLNKSEEGYYNENDEGHAWPLQPDGIVGKNVCSSSGNLVDNPSQPDCPTRFEYFLKEFVGSRLEAGRQDVQIDKTTGQLANPDLPEELIETQNHPFLLDPLGTMICLDCPTASHSATISYPIR